MLEEQMLTIMIQKMILVQMSGKLMIELCMPFQLLSIQWKNYLENFIYEKAPKTRPKPQASKKVFRLRVIKVESDLFKANVVAVGCKSKNEFIRSRCIDENGSCGSDVDRIAVKN